MPARRQIAEERSQKSFGNVEHDDRMPHTFRLIYFDGRGRAELVRLIFAAANKKFEDARIDVMSWPGMRPSTPWGGLPMMEVDGRIVAQSNAIVRYLARLFMLSGEDKWQEVLVDSVVEAAGEFLTNEITIGESRAEGLQKAEAVHKFKEVTIPAVLTNFDRFIAQNGNNGFAVGNHMTVADIAIFNAVDNILHHGILAPQSLDHYPAVKAVFNAVKSHPRISNYLKERPDASF